MTKTRKLKKVIREIKPKIKVIDKKEESSKESEENKETGEAPLEEIISDAPSAREFPSILKGDVQGQRTSEPEPPVPTPASTTIEESSTGQRYAIQESVSEEEITRVYRSNLIETSRATPLSTRESSPLSARTDFTNREIEAARTVQVEEQHYVKIEPKSGAKKRKLPWEL